MEAEKVFLKKIKKSLYKPAKKNLFKWKIEETKEFLHEPMMNRDEKIEEIKNILYNSRNNLFKPENPVRICF